MSEGWKAYEAKDWTPTDAQSWLRLLVGPVRRRCLRGADAHSSHDLALRRAGYAVQTLSTGDDDQRAVAELANVWLTLTHGQDPLGTAWQANERIPAPLGGALRDLLDARQGKRSALEMLLAPHRFRDARAALRELTQHTPTFKANPGPEIFKEVRDEALTLLRAADRPSNPPPRDLRILTDDLEDWASEHRGTNFLMRTVKVWNSLVEWMHRYRSACTALVEAWTDAPPAPSPLPQALRNDPRRALPSAPDLAEALLHDLRVDASRALPVLLDPKRELGLLAKPAAALDVHDRIRLLAPARERLALVDVAPPAWVSNTTSQLDALRAEAAALRTRAQGRRDATHDLTSRTRLGEVVASLDEARKLLDQDQSRDATEWMDMARDLLDSAVADAELANLEARASTLFERLRATNLLPASISDLPLADADAPNALRDAVSLLETTWAEAVSEHETRLAALRSEASRVHGAQANKVIQHALSHATAMLEQDDLARATASMSFARDRILGARASLERCLSPSFTQLLGRSRQHPLHPDERHSLEAELLRAQARSDVGLDTTRQREALLHFVEALERGQVDALPLLAAADAAGRLQPLCWWDAAVAVSPERAARIEATLPRTPSGQLVHLSPQGDASGHMVTPVNPPSSGQAHDPKAEAPASFQPSTTRFGPVYRTETDADHPPKLTAPPPPSGELFYLEGPTEVHGPYRLFHGVPVAADPRGVVGALPAHSFWQLFGRVALPSNDGLRRVVDPPSLDELLHDGGRMVDRMPDDHAGAWLQGLLSGVAEVTPQTVQQAIERVASLQLPTELIDRRLRRLQPLLAVSESLTGARERAVQDWLEGAQGAHAVQQAARAIVHARRDLLDAAVVEERARLTEAVADLKLQIDEQRSRLAAARAEADAAEAIRDDARFALVARWGLGGGAPAIPRPPRAVSPPEDPGLPVDRLDALVDRTAEGIGHDRTEVAALLLSLATTHWTLLAGPPGVGKSTFVRRTLHRLGQGPDTSRYLELVVRRDWQDDAALFGFWHPGHHRWEPSSEGLCERLLAAAADHEAGGAGLYAVVLEELNLASPEHYLARPISALEDASPRLRLYGEGLAPTNADAYPATFPIYSNVRWVGTVNIDDTVERLSPRFLSRSAVLWVEPDVDTMLSDAPPVPPEPEPVRWADVTRLAHSVDPAPIGPLTDVLRRLHSESVPGAPTPRAVQAMRRFIAAAQGVLAPEVARDLAVLQRVIPSLRGVGSRYRSLFSSLADDLDRASCPRSASRVRRMRARGEALGDFYDAFHG